MATQMVKQVTYGPAGEVVDCLFCRIANGGERNPIWLQDDRVAVFVPNRSLAGRLHFLVVPRAHVHQLGERMYSIAGAVGLLDHMEVVARKVLSSAVAAGVTHTPLAAPPAGFGVGEVIPPLPPQCRLAFHRPPFNSVDHLHLHALCTPFRTTLQHAKFAVGAYGCKRSSWLCRPPCVITLTSTTTTKKFTSAPSIM